MTAYLTSIVIVLIVALVVGVRAIIKGETPAEKMLTVQLCSTAGVAILMLFATLEQNEDMLNVAILLAVLATVVIVGFVRAGGNRS